MDNVITKLETEKLLSRKLEAEKDTLISFVENTIFAITM